MHEKSWLYKILKLYVDSHLKWNEHIKNTTEKIRCVPFIIRKLRSFFIVQRCITRAAEILKRNINKNWHSAPRVMRRSKNRFCMCESRDYELSIDSCQTTLSIAARRHWKERPSIKASGLPRILRTRFKDRTEHTCFE